MYLPKNILTSFIGNVSLVLKQTLQNMDQAGLGQKPTGKRNWINPLNSLDKQAILSASPMASGPAELSLKTQNALVDYANLQQVKTSLGSRLKPYVPIAKALPTKPADAQLLRIAELEQQLALAKKENQKSKRYLANLSHEIRNSVNTIVGMTSLLQDNESPSERQNYLGYLKEASDMLLALMTNVLDLSKMDQGKLQPSNKAMALEPLLNSLAKTTSFRLWDKPVHFEYYLSPNLPAQVVSDKVLLYQILLNLLSNAIKFTEEGTISFSVRPTGQAGNICWVAFTIADTGVGFPEQVKPRLFQPFTQVGSSEYNSQGAGLGLSITKNLLDLMGGHIEVVSEPGKGSKFTVQLPFKVQDEQASQSVKALMPTPLSQKGIERILVVEDNPLNQAYFQSILGKWGYQVHLAKDGPEALSLLENQVFDLVFLDLRIPKINGFETCIRLRNMVQGKNQLVPVIATSGSIAAEDKNKAESVGMNDYLCKPFSPQEIYQTIAKYQMPIERVKVNTFEFSNVFDQHSLEQLYMGNYSQVQLMFDIFLRNTPSSFATIEENWEKGDWGALNDHLHRIKPTFTMVGLREVSDLANQLEENTKQTNPRKSIQKTFSNFKKAVLDSIRIVTSEKEKLDAYQLLNP